MTTPQQPKKPVLTSIMPDEAWEMLQADATMIFVDIRSSGEFFFVGHPKGAIHLAWVDEPDWVVNPYFINDVRRVAQNKLETLENKSTMSAENIPLLLICRSGHRTLDAGKLLCDSGFTKVYNVLEGFEGPLDEERHRGTLGGWRYYKLPWEQC
jgi:rhodanese-related sulfurtransferase